MTDHDQRACQRCGEPAGIYHFCPSCRAQLTGSPTRDGTPAAAGTPRELLYEQTSNGDGNPVDRETSTALQVDPDPRVAEGTSPEAAAAAGERAQLPSTASDRFSIVAPPPREVARLENVLTIKPTQNYDASLASDLEVAEASAAPVAEVEVPVIVEESTPEVEEAAPVEEIAPSVSPELRARMPHYVAAHMLRAAFWFEQTSAFEARRDDEPEVVEVPEATVPPVESVPPPVESVPPPVAPTNPEPVFVAVPEDHASQNHWLIALCFLALIALVVVLTGRAPQRRAGTGA